jgi:putative sugar O-methyltransferase
MNFTKIDQALHSKTKKYFKKLILKNNSKKIIKKKLLTNIKNFYKKFYLVNKYGGTWEWIDKNKRSKNINHAFSNDKLLKKNFLNFFRLDLSFGIISSHWKKKTNKWKKHLTSNILKNINSWEEFTKTKDRDYNFLDSSNDPGNPYGLSYKKKLIMFDTPRHDYYAKKIIDLFHYKKCPTILEIGGGYGGLLNQLIRRKFRFNYINIDLPNTILINFYYISSIHKKIKINFKESLAQSDIKKGEIFFLPFSKTIFKKLNFKPDLIFNSNSFSEMDQLILKKYFFIINKKLKPKFILHQNSNVLLYPDSKSHVEIQSERFPLDKKKYVKVYFHPSIFQGGSGRYREYFYKRTK